MELDLNFLLEKVPDFYHLGQTDQVKYLCFVHIKNTQNNFLQPKDIKELFNKFNLVLPSNFYREFTKLSQGRPPILVKKAAGYAIHPKTEQEMTLEFFSQPEASSDRKVSAKKTNTELFNRYDLHSEIKRVAFSQFQDGYYKEAVLNAFVEVIEKVKAETGYPKIEKNGRQHDLDGDDLMNRAFGCDNGQTPMIAFNSLLTSLDRAEQRGLMYLFKGVVGIRDKKAHLNFIQNDPLKTVEYLSLASLLLRLLDESK